MRKPFYGWIIVGVSFLIGFTESGVFQNILSIFMKPMVAEFGWTRASVTGAIAFGSISGGLLSLVVGPILDRYGPRMVAFWGIVFLSLGLGAMTFVNHLWQLYLFFGVGRMIAVGVLSLAISVTVANWFVRQRGRAMGITRVGDRLGSALLPLMVQFLILALGWRFAWGTLGAVVFFMSGIPALLFLRHRPEDMGLLPDGASPVFDKKGTEGHSGRIEATGSDSEQTWTRAQATRTRAFWLLTFVNSLIPFMQAGINFHIYPFLTDQGFSETNAVLVLTTVAVFGMAGSPLWGILAEKFRIQRILAVNVAGNGLLFLLFYWAVLFRFDGAAGTGLIFLLAALHGIFHGGRNPMLPVIWADFFGRRSLGSIYSLANPLHFTANAIGPVFAGLCFDLFGSYAFPFYFFVATFFLSAIVTLRMQPPKHPSRVP
ncbi:MAG: MFS transporter [Proteobacteria bacterium]|nr:MFS transporter [Pseudomonadota bacterium]MBU2228362.1 MFS transporter [Pseudomonadota bacterium]